MDESKRAISMLTETEWTAVSTLNQSDSEVKVVSSAGAALPNG